MKKNRIKAFTLYEIMVVIGLTAFTLLTIYSIYSFTGRLFQMNTQNISKSHNFSQLHHVLYNDFNNCIKAEENLGDVKLIFENNEIIYRFEEEYIVRHNDTFFFQPVYIDITTINNTKLVNTIDIGFNNSRFYLTKEYQHKVLFNITDIQ